MLPACAATDQRRSPYQHRRPPINAAPPAARSLCRDEIC